jgi:hypothetical protein
MRTNLTADLYHTARAICRCCLHRFSRHTLYLDPVTSFGSAYLITSDHQLYRVTPLKTPVRLLIPFVTVFTHTYVTTITIIHYAVSHLHSLQSYTFVTTITYYTLTLADFSAINYCLKLSHTLHLHTSKLSPRSYSANSHLTTPS